MTVNDNQSAVITQTRRKYIQTVLASAGLLGLGSGSATAGTEQKAANPTDLCFTSATVLAERIHAGELSPVDLVEAFLDRIEERDDELNAFIEVTPERALQAAQEAEQAVEDGEDLGPLHGVPLGVKDLDSVEGVRFTSGTLAYEDRIGEDTSYVVQQLLDAGAIVIGTTNTPEFGYTGKTDNLLVGPTSTPFDLERNSGGSSGGSAAAVADGLAPIATGSDGAGSIRIPASFTGTFGMIPSFRRIPRPEGNPFRSGSTFSQQGVQTRTVADTALGLSVTAGPDDGDPYSLPDAETDYLGALDQSVDGLSVAYSPDLGTYPVDERVRTVVGENVAAIEDAGATVESIDLDLGVSYEELIDGLRIMWDILLVEVADSLEDDGFDVLGDDSNLFPPEMLEFVETGRERDALEINRNDQLRTTVFDAIQDVFSEYDLLVTATLSVPPFPNSKVGPTEVEGVEIHPILGWLITAVFNMTGNPAASVPAGLTDEGLPVGMQLVGPRFGDETVIAASAAYEETNPWHDDYPGK